MKFKILFSLFLIDLTDNGLFKIIPTMHLIMCLCIYLMFMYACVYLYISQINDSNDKRDRRDKL